MLVEANCARQVIVQEIMIHKLIVETTNVVHSRADLQESCMCSPGASLSWCRVAAIQRQYVRMTLAYCFLRDVRSARRQSALNVGITQFQIELSFSPSLSLNVLSNAQDGKLADFHSSSVLLSCIHFTL